ncbi:MAG: hypothetical protein AAF798_19565 [Bacteroidota bacterium]
MKNIQLILVLLFPVVLAAQSTQPIIPEEAYTIYPTLEQMEGYAYGTYDNRLLILGGRIKAEVSEEYAQYFPNTDVLMIDLEAKRAIALSAGSLEGTLAEHLIAYGYSFHQRGTDLFIIGGYGYSESADKFITFPYLTAIDLPNAIRAIDEVEPPAPFFYQYCEEDLAHFDALLEYNEETYFILNGKRATKLDPFEDHPVYQEELLEQQVRSFQLRGKAATLKVKDIQVWYDLESMQEYLGPIVPEGILREWRGRGLRVEGFEG